MNIFFYISVWLVYIEVMLALNELFE